jgi:hypothetical protein
LIEEEGPHPEPEPEPPNDNAADERAIGRKRQKLKLAERQEIEFWKSVMATEVGRRAIWKLLDAAHTFDARFACGPNGMPQPEATWFEAGRQDLGFRFYHMLARNDRVLILKMHDENDPYYAANTKPKETE